MVSDKQVSCRPLFLTSETFGYSTPSGPELYVQLTNLYHDELNTLFRQDGQICQQKENLIQQYCGVF